MNALPRISFILLTPDSFATIRASVANLAAQTARAEIELVIVAPTRLRDLDETLTRHFFSARTVQIDAMDSTSLARAAGIRAATAPIVAFVEDHSFPNATWAEAILRAYRDGYVAVGPAIGNANPASVISWANLLGEYGEWFDHPGGAVTHLPGHNSTYERAALLELGARLENLLEAETTLQRELIARGRTMYLEASARTDHQNFARLVPSLALRFNGGRLFASARARGWTFARRWLYVFGAPLIPLIRARRIWKWTRRTPAARRNLARALPALIFLLAVDALGELCGYAFGGGSAMRRVSEMEFHRERFLEPEARGGA